jgi:hypothetical protein
MAFQKHRAKPRQGKRAGRREAWKGTPGQRQRKRWAESVRERNFKAWVAETDAEFTEEWAADNDRYFEEVLGLTVAEAFSNLINGYGPIPIG